MKIIHVIGKVGAGKSHFITRVLSRKRQILQKFDVKDVYRETGHTPKELMDPTAMAQFSTAMEHKISAFVSAHRQMEGLFVVESSGMNKSINRALMTFEHDVILVTSPFSSSPKIHRSRPYATNLNMVFDRKMKRGEIRFDFQYVADKTGKGKFVDEVPDILVKGGAMRC